uniref:Uncharacterized protein n=1 Tax=Micrurus lemniscatus lemniscatus TaxID=129467 RepID=A0A2D4HRY5_MICLE
MTFEDVRDYEKNMHEKTNIKVCNQHSSPVDEIENHAKGSVCSAFKNIAHHLLMQTRNRTCCALGDCYGSRPGHCKCLPLLCHFPHQVWKDQHKIEKGFAS